jgi:perosamine synthetase
MPVHIYGHPVDMDPIVALADRHGFAIIEDAAEAPGAEYQSGRGDWRRCGEFGTASTFSFYANKPITTGEGGMVVTDDDAVAARLRSLRDLGFSPTRRFLHHDLGYNYRLTNLQAALGVAQLKRLDDGLARKRAVAGAYRACLAGVQGITLQAERPWARSIYWMVGLTLDDQHPMTAADLSHALAARDIETRPFFLGMHDQPALRNAGMARDRRYPVADRLARQGLYLPSGPLLTRETIEHIASAVRGAIQMPGSR